MSETVHVAVAVIVNQADEVCISLRHKQAHQGGLWEFPGGKIEKHETPEQALAREIKEELNLVIQTSRPFIMVKHGYQDKKVCLHVYKVLRYSGDAAGAEGQEVTWVPVNQLSDFDFPAANLAIIKALQLPEKYLITGKFVDEEDFLKKLREALHSGIKLVQLRLKAGDLQVGKVPELIQQASTLCVSVNAKLLLNIPEDFYNLIDMSTLVFDGYHADSKKLKQLSMRPAGELFSASCHTMEEILKAEQLHADFIVLSPVQKTASHPEMQAMGWPAFSDYVEKCRIPVYALGGVSESDIETACLHGAQGVAAISAFWR